MENTTKPIAVISGATGMTFIDMAKICVTALCEYGRVDEAREMQTRVITAEMRLRPGQPSTALDIMSEYCNLK